MTVTLWYKAFLEKSIALQVAKKLPNFMEPKYSLRCSQIPALDLHPEPVEVSPHPLILFP
jgi:hypothetical protein